MLVAGAVVEQRRVLQRALDGGDVHHRARAARRASAATASSSASSATRASPPDSPMSRCRASGSQLDVDSAEAALAVGDGAVDEHAERVVVQALEADDPGAGEERAVHLEAGVLGGGAEQGDHAALDVGQHRVLLRLVEAVDLVDEQDGALADAAALARPAP